MNLRTHFPGGALFGPEGLPVVPRPVLEQEVSGSPHLTPVILHVGGGGRGGCNNHYCFAMNVYGQVWF